MQQAIVHSQKLDKLAMGLSGLCMIHCLASAVIVAMVASAGAFLLHPAIHEAGLAIAIGLGVLALGRGMMTHRRILPASIGALGLGVMAGALAMPHGGGEALCTIIGVALVAFGHGLNRRALS